MDCKQALDEFLFLDHGESLPAELTHHVAECASCRRQVARMRSIFIALEREGLAEAPDGSTEAIMAEIRSAADEPLSVAKWLGTGVIILASIVLVSFSNSHTWLSRFFGMSLELPLSIILGAAITIYATLFIGTHVHKVAAFFGLRHRR